MACVLKKARSGQTGDGRSPKLTSLLCGALSVCAALALMLAAACGFYKGLIDTPVKTLASLALCVVFVFSVSVLAVRWRLSRSKLLATVVAAGIVVRMSFVLLVNTLPVSDFSLLYQSATDLAGGNTAFLQVGYFRLWSYQIPFVLYESMVIRVLPSIWTLKALNVAFMAGIDAMVFLLASRHTTKESAFACALLFALSLEPLLLSSVLTNQHISLFLILCGLYAFFADERAVSAVLGGILLAAGNLMRPDAAVAAAGAALALVILAARGPGSASCRLMRAAMMLTFFVLTQLAVSQVLGRLGLAPYGIGNNCPEWKIVVGLDPRSVGSYTEANEHILWIADPAARRAEALRIIRSFSMSFADLLDLLKSKFFRFWGNPATSSWAFASVGGDTARAARIHDVISAFITPDKAAFVLAATLAAIGCVLPRVHGEETPPSALAAACVLLAFIAAMLVVEIQDRYRYFAYPFIFMLASRGLDAAGVRLFRFLGAHRSASRSEAQDTENRAAN